MHRDLLSRRLAPAREILQQKRASSQRFLLAPRGVKKQATPNRCFDAASVGDAKKDGAVRSLALSEHRGQILLVLEDPGGEPLDRFLPGPMQMPQFLGFAAGLATALGGLHKRELIHKDVKPANVLVNPARGQIWLMGRILPPHSG
jgi:serine/threonine protein kinase